MPSYLSQKHEQRKKKNRYLDSVKTQNFCTSKDTIKKIKRYPQNGRKYLQFIYLIRDLYTEW